MPSREEGREKFDGDGEWNPIMSYGLGSEVGGIKGYSPMTGGQGCFIRKSILTKAHPASSASCYEVEGQHCSIYVDSKRKACLVHEVVFGKFFVLVLQSGLPLSWYCFFFYHLTFFLQIQVIEDDRNNRGSEPFVTGVRGQVPPLVTTNFLVKDQGKLNFNVCFPMAANSLRLSAMDHAFIDL